MCVCILQILTSKQEEAKPCLLLMLPLSVTQNKSNRQAQLCAQPFLSPPIFFSPSQLVKSTKRISRKLIHNSQRFSISFFQSYSCRASNNRTTNDITNKKNDGDFIEQQLIVTRACGGRAPSPFDSSSSFYSLPRPHLTDWCIDDGRALGYCQSAVKSVANLFIDRVDVSIVADFCETAEVI